MRYHAFAIVADDGDGFWLQNSWGDAWGRKGFARISYDEWLERGTDVWVARLAVPVHLQRAQSAAVSNSAIGRQSVGYSQADLRPHVIRIGNDGRLRATEIGRASWRERVGPSGSTSGVGVAFKKKHKQQ